MTKLLEQMTQDMVLRGMAPSTQRAYLQAVTKFAHHCDRAPDRISNGECRSKKEAGFSAPPISTFLTND